MAKKKRAVRKRPTDVNKLAHYLDAVDWAFSGNIDYAMLVKMYGNDRESEVRYSPAECRCCALLLRVQLRENSPHAACDACDGRWRGRSALGSVGPSCA